MKERQNKAKEERLRFGERLSKLRRNNGFGTQAEFAEYLDVPLSTYKKWEQGTKMPNKEHMDNILRRTGCDPEYFNGEIEKKNYDLQFVCDYTGLSEKAAEVLRFLSDRAQTSHEDILDILNYILETQFYMEASKGALAHVSFLLPGKMDFYRSKEGPLLDNKENILYMIKNCVTVDPAAWDNPAARFKMPDGTKEDITMPDLVSHLYRNRLITTLTNINDSGSFREWKKHR